MSRKWNEIRLFSQIIFDFSCRLTPELAPFTQALCCRHLPLQGSNKAKYNSTMTQHNAGHIPVLSERSLFSPSLCCSFSFPRLHPFLHLTSPSFLYFLISPYCLFISSCLFAATTGAAMRDSFRLFGVLDFTSLHETAHACQALFVCLLVNTLF